MPMFVYILIVIAVAFVGYVRLTSSPTQRWHVAISAETDNDMEGAAIRVIPNAPETMKKLEAALGNLPRTTLLAGAMSAGHATYITRSKWVGFPDYTTIEESGETIKMFARLRFGRADMGVNAARLRKLISALN